MKQEVMKIRIEMSFGPTEGRAQKVTDHPEAVEIREYTSDSDQHFVTIVFEDKISCYPRGDEVCDRAHWILDSNSGGIGQGFSCR